MQVGIRLDVSAIDHLEMFQKLGDPGNHYPLALAYGGGKDYPNGSTFFPFLFGNEGIGACCNTSLVGATSAQLAKWGYPVRSVPTVDTRIQACLPLTGGAQTQCWAALDEYLMLNVVPWIPYVFGEFIGVVSSRVRSYSFDQFAARPALDRIALR